MIVPAQDDTPQLFCLGVNYRTTPVALRERFAVPKSRVPQAVAELHALPGVEECVLLSTCNRTEIYYWSYSGNQAEESLLNYYRGKVEEDVVLHSCFYRYTGEDVLRHLARVASGLDSMVLGETEIFGQLKDAYFVALESGTTAGFANRTFQQVFSIGKKTRSTTRITSGPTSVGAAGVQMATRILGNLNGANVLIVGAGEVARTTAQSLRSRGANGIFVANRSFDRATALAAEVGGQVIRFTEWIPYLEQIDIVIVSTASPVYVVSPQVLEAVQAKRKRPLFLIDLSVPRNVNPACAMVPDVHVYDMDAMQAVADETRRNRSAEMQYCEKLIADWLQESGKALLQNNRRKISK